MAAVPRKPVPQRNDAVPNSDEAVLKGDETTPAYSTLEAVDPERPPELVEDSGLQSTHLFGDNTLNGKEVAKADGMEVTRDDDKELSTPTDLDLEKAEKIEWKKRRVFGIPLLLLIAITLLLIVGGVVGGAVGGTVGRNQAIGPTPTTSSTSMMPTTTATPTPIPTSKNGPQDNMWYRLIQYTRTEDRHIALLENEKVIGTNTDSSLKVALTEMRSLEGQGQEEHFWIFTPAWTQRIEEPLVFEGKLLYWISSKYGWSDGASFMRARENSTAYMQGDTDIQNDPATMWFVEDSQTGRINDEGLEDELLWSIWNYQTRTGLGRREDSVKLVANQSEGYDYLWFPMEF